MRYFLNLRWPENLPDEVGKPLSNPEEPIDRSGYRALEVHGQATLLLVRLEHQ